MLVPSSVPRVAVVGGGFAGFYALRRLQRLLPAGTAELVLVTPHDCLLDSPLLPEVATGVIDARHIAVSLRRSLPRVRLVLGLVQHVNLQARRLTVLPRQEWAEPRELTYDRLVLAPGSVTRQFDTPGVPEQAPGLESR